MRFLYSAITTISFKIIAMASTLGVSILISRVLGPEGRGIYGLIMTIIMIASTFGVFGIGKANTYFIAQDNSKSQKLGLLSLLTAFSGTVLSAVLIYICTIYQPKLLTGLTTTLLWMTVGLIFVFIAGQLFSQAYLGLQNVIAFNLFHTSERFISFLLAILILFIFGQTFQFFLTIVLSVLSLFLFGYIIRFFRQSLNSATGIGELLKKSITYGIRSYIATIFTIVAMRSGLFVINYFLSPAEVGYYSIAQQISELLIIIPSVIGGILFPRVAEDSTNNLTLQVLRTMTVVFLPLFIFLFFFTEPVITILFGEEFIPSTMTLLLLLPGSYFLGLQVIIAGDISGRGYPWKAALIWIPVSILNLTGYFYFTPIYGINAVAVTNSITFILTFFYMTYLLKTETGATLAQMYIINRDDFRKLLSVKKILKRSNGNS